MSGGVTHMLVAASGWARAGTIATVVAAVAGTVIASLVAVMPYARRPKLSLIEDSARTQSRVEGTDTGGMPHIRLMAANTRGRRAARDVRVLIEGYRPLSDPAAPLTALGHPPLGWPSATDAVGNAVTVFSGGSRPVGLGQLIRVRVGTDGKLMRQTPETRGGFRSPHYDGGTDWGDPQVTGWYLWLGALDINNDRDKLPHLDGGYLVRLVIGADDGAARTFDVHIDWDGDPSLDADAVLASALDHLAVVKT